MQPQSGWSGVGEQRTQRVSNGPEVASPVVGLRSRQRWAERRVQCWGLLAKLFFCRKNRMPPSGSSRWFPLHTPGLYLQLLTHSEKRGPSLLPLYLHALSFLFFLLPNTLKLLRVSKSCTCFLVKNTTKVYNRGHVFMYPAATAEPPRKQFVVVST